MRPDRDILDDRHVRHQLDMLERTRHPKVGDRPCRQVSHPLPADPDFAGTQFFDPRQKIERGGLPGAVRPQKRDDLTLADGKADAVDGDKTAEPLLCLDDAQDFATCRGRSRQRHRRRGERRDACSHPDESAREQRP